jgi:hypothetical protein
MSRGTSRFGIGCCWQRRLVASAAVALLFAPAVAWTADLTASGPAKAKPAERKATSAEANAKAAALVQEALYYEIYGSAADRDRLLTAALEVVPDFAPAMWQRGYVRDGRKWVTIDEAAHRSAASSDLKRYVGRREKMHDTAAAHLEMARWCESAGLRDQARAHFSNVLDFNPNHVEARAKLNFRRVDGNWISDSDIEQLNARAKQLQATRQKWEPIAAAIQRGFASSTEQDRKTAAEQLASVSDAAALPVLQRTLSLVSEVCSTTLVGRIAKWNEPEATRALAEQSVFSPWESVRELAAKQLRDRRKEEYVPEMLAAAQQPVEHQNVMFIDEEGWLVNRDIFIREGQEKWQVMAFDTRFGRAPSRQKGTRSPAESHQSLNQAALVARSNMATQRANSEMRIALENASSGELTARILTSLKTATGQDQFADASDWWNWWNQENEVQNASMKAVAARRLAKDVAILDRGDRPNDYPQQVESQVYEPPVTRRHSCFAAGTSVWTLDGTMAIEKIRVGDVVLSQDPESGEISFKPVLRTSRRELAPTFSVETNGGQLNCTGGHLFWVAGEGWTKARDLKSGQVLHCANGTVGVSEVTEATPAPTFNLVVADNSTYFVGTERIFTHDITDRKPSRSLVPGLPRE